MDTTDLLNVVLAVKEEEFCCSLRQITLLWNSVRLFLQPNLVRLLWKKCINVSALGVLIYRPRHDILVAETRQLHDTIEALITRNPKTVILGDLSYWWINWLCKDGPAALDAISYEFIELCASSDFTHIVNKPTRLDECRDFILRSNPEDMLAVVVHPLVLFRKNHNLVECKWKSRIAESNLEIPRRNFARADYIRISNSLYAMAWKAMFCGCRTINEYWLTFYHILQQLIYDYVPVTFIRRHVTNRRHLPRNVRTKILHKQKV